jgi:hypothetical protein
LVIISTIDILNLQRAIERNRRLAEIEASRPRLARTNEAEADRAPLIHAMLDGQFSSPARIVASNTAEGWSRDVTEDIASELRRHFAERGEIPSSLKEFLEEHHG